MLKHYIISRTTELLDVVPPDGPQIDPAVAPKRAELPERLLPVEDYKDRALLVQDFESFLLLLDLVIAEQGLSPADDQTDVAAILNRFRTNEGLQPF